MNIKDDLDAELPDFLPMCPPDNPGDDLPVDEEGVWQFADDPHDDPAGGTAERLNEVEVELDRDGSVGGRRRMVGWAPQK